MKVQIIYYEISTQLESKFRGKLLKEDELAAYYEAIQARKKHQMKSAIRIFTSNTNCNR